MRHGADGCRHGGIGGEREGGADGLNGRHITLRGADKGPGAVNTDDVNVATRGEAGICVVGSFITHEPNSKVSDG